MDEPGRAGGTPLSIISGPLIGRAREVELARQLLLGNDARLITLTGPGGVGKTRLAAAVLATIQDAFSDGTAWIDLSPLRDPTHVLPAIADRLGARRRDRRTAVDSVQRFLGSRRMLLVLDNMEQVADAAPDIGELLTACPNLRVMVTSREPLRLLVERELLVSPLALPDGDPAGSVDPASVSVAPSVALFVQRARRARAGFELSRDNARTVVEVCRRLDGLPLAIELAAASLRMQSPASLLARISQSHPHDWLEARERDRPERHQTLRATFTWSYDLLQPLERVLFRRLAVFIGGFDLDAVEQVCGSSEFEEGGGVRRVLGGLIERSLVQPADEWSTDADRLRLLETTRAYALEQLRTSSDELNMQAGHARYYAALADRLMPDLQSPRQPTAMVALEREQDNVRGALRTLLGQRNRELAARMGWALWPYWYARGQLVEVQGWMQELVDAQIDVELAPVWRARVLALLGGCTYELGDHESARPLLESSLALFDSLGPTPGAGLPLLLLGYLAIERGETDYAEVLLRDGVARCRALNERPMLAFLLTALGVVCLVRGAYAAAMQEFESSLAVSLGGDPMARIHTLGNVGWLALASGQLARARAALREGVQLAQRLNNDEGLAFCIEALAGLQDDASRAGRLLGAAEALREMIGVPIWAAQRSVLETIVAGVKRRLSPEESERAWTTGRHMNHTQIRAEALVACRDPQPTRRGDMDVVLTPREREVAGLIAQGLTSKEIAERLVITETTVDTHAAHIRTRLGLRSRVEIATWVGQQLDTGSDFR